MEKTPSPPSDLITASRASSQSPPAAFSPPTSDYRTREFASNFTTLYHSIFPPKSSPLPASLSLTPPSSSSPSSSAAEFATEHRLRQARLVLEYQELCDHYEVSLARLQTLTRELLALREENSDLRSANNELVKLLTISSQAAIRSQFGGRDMHSDLDLKSALELNRFERKHSLECVTLPKSISVRTDDYLKPNMNDQGSGSNSVSNRQPVASQLKRPVSGSQRVYVRAAGGGKREAEASAMQMEVYGQGTWKTELCNKWQETGACPYGIHCQFAHGITELRPVMRHPRYKTQVCRMILSGGTCPYGHRCHFRHSLTTAHRQEDRLVAPR